MSSLSDHLPRTWKSDVEERAHILVSDIPLIKSVKPQDVHLGGFSHIVTRDLPDNLPHSDWVYWAPLAIGIQHCLYNTITDEFRNNPNAELTAQTACYEWLMSDKELTRPVSMTEVLIAAFAIQPHLQAISSLVRAARLATRPEEELTIGDLAFALSTFRHQMFGAMYLEAEPSSADENATVLSFNHKRHWWMTLRSKPIAKFRTDGEHYDALIWSWLFGYVIKEHVESVDALCSLPLTVVVQCVLSGIDSCDAITAVANNDIDIDLAGAVFS